MLDSLRVMQLYTFLVVLALCATTWCSAIPKPDDDHKKRVYDKKLSDQQHETNGFHNADYDHEAILGRDDAKDFDQLSPEESKERLGKIVEKMDKDKDGHITELELKEWIKYVQDRYVIKDTDDRWKEYELGSNNLDWENFKKRTYGFTEEDLAPNDERAVYKEMIVRDKRRWNKADLNKDSLLSKDEFIHFLHPEEAEHMRDIVVMETMEDIDKDKDGKVSLEEYIGDMWRGDTEGEAEPDWVKGEREQFSSYRDKNSDGLMDHDEVKDWLLPSDYDHSKAEANHLIFESDKNKDGKLSKEEILDKYDLFVGSQATDFGEALKTHDEF